MEKNKEYIINTANNTKKVLDFKLEQYTFSGASGDVTAFVFKEVTSEKMSEFDIVVFGGGLHAGIVNGLKKAKEMFKNSSAKSFIVFVTGGTPNEAKEARFEQSEMYPSL